MRQDWEPFLSLDKADGERPGEMCDLGTVLASHSMVAWIDGYEFRGTARLPVVALEVSHDGIRLASAWTRRCGAEGARRCGAEGARRCGAEGGDILVPVPRRRNRPALACEICPGQNHGVT